MESWFIDHGIQKSVTFITFFLRSITNLFTFSTDSNMDVFRISCLPVDFVGFEAYLYHYRSPSPEFLERFLIKIY